MSELYKLPNGWEWKNLSSICRFINGKAYKKVELLNSGKYPVLRVGNFFTNNNWYYSDLELPDDKYCDYGDLLYAWSASFGPKIWTGKKSIYHYHIWKLIPNYELVDKSFLYQILDWDVEQIKLDQGTGTTMIHITKGSIEARMVPIPPLKEQKRIVSKLDTLFKKIDKAIELHEKNIKESDAFMGSVLNEVFEELEKKYDSKELFKIAEVNRGKSKHRPRNDKKLFGGKYPFIQTGDVRKSNKYINSYENTYSEFGLSQSKLWKKGTICLTIAANIGDVAILDIESCFPDSIVGIYSDDNLNDFLYYFFLTLKQHLESKATTTAQMNINLKVLQSIGVPLPSLETQQKTVKYLDEVSLKIEKTKAIQKEKLQNLKDLKASILDQAFKGQL